METTEPVKPQELLDQLDELDLKCVTESHEPFFTVEEAKALRVGQPGQGHNKNLFLRDKKKKMFLITVHEDKQIDLAALAEKLGSKGLSFGRPERLMEFLGVMPGSVSPFALINDTSQQVEFWVDHDLMQNETLYFHPLDNSMTTAISPAGLTKFLEEIVHPAHELIL